MRMIDDVWVLGQAKGVLVKALAVEREIFRSG